MAGSYQDFDGDESFSNEAPTIIIDNGSGSIKAGLSNYKEPKIVFPTVVGRPRKRYEQMFDQEMFIGNEAMENLAYLNMTYPIDHGHIDDWLEVEEIWRHTYKKLGCNPENNPVILTEPPLCSSKHRENMAEIMFEVFSVPELNISVSGLMAIYATGGLTGCIVDVGEGMTQCVPVVDGYLDKKTIMRSDFGGQEMTLLLNQTLCDMGYLLTSRQDQEIVKSIKENYCFCSTDPSHDASRTDLNVVFQLPDGCTLRDGVTKEIKLGPERIYPSEALFDPRLIYRDNLPIHELICQSLAECPIDQRKNLLSKIFLSGGSTLFQNFKERLEHELRNIVPKEARNVVKVTSLENHQFLVWLGAQIFSRPSMRSMSQNYWITKDDYNETGIRVVHLKAALK